MYRWKMFNTRSLHQKQSPVPVFFITAANLITWRWIFCSFKTTQRWCHCLKHRRDEGDKFMWFRWFLWKHHTLALHVYTQRVHTRWLYMCEQIEEKKASFTCVCPLVSAVCLCCWRTTLSSWKWPKTHRHTETYAGAHFNRFNRNHCCPVF